MTSSYPWYTPYQFAGNKPIYALDLDGLEELPFMTHYEMYHGNVVLAVGSYVQDWYYNDGASDLDAFGHGLHKVAHNLAPVRLVTPEEEIAAQNAGGSLNYAWNSFKNIPNIPKGLYHSTLNYINTLENGSREDVIEQTTAFAGTLIGTFRGKGKGGASAVVKPYISGMSEILAFKKAGNLTAFRKGLDNFDWGGYLKNTLKVAKPTDMYRAHAHHIVMKVGNAWSEKSRTILEKFEIDPYFSIENLTWAPNAYKNHSKSASKHVYESLLKASETGERSKVIEVLKSLGEKMANGEFK